MSESRAWLDKAMCYGRNPRLYETDGYRNSRVLKSDRAERARNLCAGCPVIRECAAEAIEPIAVATIRAGVWIDATVLGRDRKAVKAQLQAVALGRSVVSHGD